MNRSTAAAFALCFATSLLPVSAWADSQQGSLPGPLSRPAARRGWVADRANPYSRLFEPTASPLANVAAVDVTPKPTSKCGMTMFPVDPRLDPRIAKHLARDSTRFTIRGVDPTICR